MKSAHLMHAHTAGRLAMEGRQLEALKGSKDVKNPEAVKAAAQQFEALFLGMMLKQMRDATPQNDLLGSDQQKMMTEFLDQQIAQNIASNGKGVGLADMIAKQMTKMQGNEQTNSAATASRSNTANNNTTRDPIGNLIARLDAAQNQRSAKNQADSLRANSAAYTFLASIKPNSADLPSNAADFVNKMWPHAIEAAKSLSVPPHYIIGHAALETAWGKREIRGMDGRNSYNLFGIKANPGWKGDYVEAWTTEYNSGVPVKTIQRFRAYGSYAEGFQDYANFLRSNQRYKELFKSDNLSEQQYAAILHRAGYATDPGYGSKLTKVLQSDAMRGTKG